MELKCISFETASLIMDALTCAYLELVAELDEDRADEAAEYARAAFVRFCEAAEIDLIENPDYKENEK